jgi:hypothetical protein
MFTQAICSCCNGRIESLPTSVELKHSPVDRVETRHRSTKIYRFKRAFSASIESKRSPINHAETLFQFPILVVQLSHHIDQRNRAVSDAVPQ